MLSTETARCLLIDDEPIARRIIRNYLSRLKGYEVTAECNHALEGFQLLQHKPIDLLFLDIQMPQLNGLDLLRSLQQPPKVIIISAHRQFALEGFELDVVDYLLKPVTFERFLKALDKFRQHWPGTQAARAETFPAEEQHLFIRADRKTVKLALREILYIESMSDYLKIYTPAKTYLTKEKISAMEEKLPDRFLRIHRSFIINTLQLQAYTPEIAEVAGQSLPISRSLRSRVLKALEG